jgi:L-alanine-DL-glutamate epimerase-like enolase superfamily enzyme
MEPDRIVAVAGAVLEGARPRAAGSNARLGPHGTRIEVPILQITTASGAVGFGRCRASAEQAAELLGRDLAELFRPERGVLPAWQAFDFPLWDLAGKQAGRPVYALAAELAGLRAPESLSVPCYDTSLYFDDLHLVDERAAAELLAAEACEGAGRGHRAFKIKVGRGARHMPPEAGLHRDIAVVRAVRAAVGAGGTIMVDANNGYTLNLSKELLEATADCAIFWIEEAFHEDDVLYRDLRAWLDSRGLAVLLADGEGQADPRLLDWARGGVVDVIQYDIFSYGFTSWLLLGQRLDGWNIRSAPHHYGCHYGNYVAGHLAGAIQRFGLVEWDEATVPGLDTGRYRVAAGQVTIPDSPGFGIDIDTERFADAVKRSGFARTL